MNMTRAVIFMFGLLVTIGGVIGHAKAASVVSLIAGLVFGLMICFCAVLVSYKELLGYRLAMGTVTLLLLIFGYRYTLSYKFMPAGMMAILSLLVLWVIQNKLKKISTKGR